MAKRNLHAVSNFDDFLKDEGMFEEVQAKALKRALSEQIEESMQAANISKVKMAEMMATAARNWIVCSIRTMSRFNSIRR